MSGVGGGSVTDFACLERNGWGSQFQAEYVLEGVRLQKQLKCQEGGRGEDSGTGCEKGTACGRNLSGWREMNEWRKWTLCLRQMMMVGKRGSKQTIDRGGS